MIVLSVFRLLVRLLTTDSQTEQQPHTVTDEDWTWSHSRKIWYHLDEDGSYEWFKA